MWRYREGSDGRPRPGARRGARRGNADDAQARALASRSASTAKEAVEPVPRPDDHAVLARATPPRRRALKAPRSPPGSTSAELMTGCRRPALAGDEKTERPRQNIQRKEKRTPTGEERRGARPPPNPRQHPASQPSTRTKGSEPSAAQMARRRPDHWAASRRRKSCQPSRGSPSLHMMSQDGARTRWLRRGSPDRARFARSF